MYLTVEAASAEPVKSITSFIAPAIQCTEHTQLQSDWGIEIEDNLKEQRITAPALRRAALAAVVTAAAAAAAAAAIVLTLQHYVMPK
jgi:hypothetical protein